MIRQSKPGWLLARCYLVLGYWIAINLAGRMVGAQGIGFRVGGSFDDLAPEQQELVRRWHDEYNKIMGNRIDAQTGYDNLKLSVRTTFQAVTHALLHTKLTASDGRSLGNALSLVKLVESVHGDIPQTRGDEQFRIYVLLQDDALEKLNRCTQFRRTADNAVYHIGYPINFRQQGGTPSIQFSVTRTGLRADIDVDYRPSGGPKALINGHLTAANSDVRAGGNYFRHINRWEGLGDWWHKLFGLTRTIPKSDLEALSSGYRKPAVGSSQPIQAAVFDFYKTWLQDEKPQIALSYMSVKANACIAAYATGESARDSMIRLRLFERMRKLNQELGDVERLNDVLQGVVTFAPGSRPVQQPHGSLFYIANVQDSLARALDCRKTFELRLAQDLPRATTRFGDYYSAFTIIRAKDNKGSGQQLFQVWHREGDTWKIVSWHLENPFDESNGPRLVEAQAAESGEAKTNAADPQLIKTIQEFLYAWLVKRDIPVALKSVAPEAQSCAVIGTAPHNASSPAAEQKWFAAVAADIPKRDTLIGAIQRVEFSDSHMREAEHSDPDSYSLVQISDDLASMYTCTALRNGMKPATGDIIGKPFYTLNIYQIMFQPRHTEGDRGTVVLTWARRQGRWMVISFDVLTF